jgi:hypothetical protein
MSDETSIDPEIHAALTGQYGDILDDLAHTVDGVLSVVQDAMQGSAGLAGDGPAALYNAGVDAHACLKDVHMAMKACQELLPGARNAYVSNESNSTRSFTNLGTNI